MDKKVNISAIKSKMHFIYKDEREKNIAAIVIFNKDGKFFFDPEYKNEMSNLEVEALLLRGALVDRGGKYYRPSSFNENNVSFSDAVINPEDIEVDLSGYALKDELNAKADINDIPTKISELQNDSNFISSIPSEYVTETELNNKGYLTQHQSLDDYATKSYVSSEIAKAQLEGEEVNLTGYATKDDLNAKADIKDIPTKTSELQNDSNFLSSIPSEYVTETELNNKGYLTGIPEEYVTDEELNNKGYLTQHQDLSGYITKDELNTKDFASKSYVSSEIAKISFSGESVEPSECDMPKVFFNGVKPTTKDDVNAVIEYISKTNHFKAYVTIKCQGTSSMNYPKKNYTIKIFDDEEKENKLKKDFKGWGEQNKFCLKANYIDHSHARNICCAKLWGQIVKTRNDFDDLPSELTSSPNMGAIDGFPFKLYYNNSYEGIYTWNIPKDAWMTNMDDKLDTHCILCGEEYVSGCFREVNANKWSDEIHENMPNAIATSFNAFQNFVLNSTDDDFINNLSDYANINSLIDYYIFNYAICGLDSMGKNQLFLTYDGVTWIASAYDMDSTMGLYWNGKSFVSSNYKMQKDYESGVHTSSSYNGEGNLLYVRLEALFKDEIRARYSELRNDVLSYANVVNVFERFMEPIDTELYNEDTTIYTGIPSAGTNNIQQIRKYYRDRLTYVDSMIMKDPDVPDVPDVPEDNLVYTLGETQILDGTSKYIDTGIALIEEDIDYSIFINFSMNSYQSKQKSLIHCMNEVSPYPGINLQTDNGCFILSGANIAETVKVTSTGTTLLPMTTETKYGVIIRREGDTITMITEAGEYSCGYTHKSTDKHLLIGAYQSSSGVIDRYVNCTVYQAKIWTRALSNDEISSYISGN